MVALASAFVRVRPQIDKAEARKAGEQIGTEAGAGAGRAYGEQFTRGSDGKLRDSRGKFVKDSEVSGAAAGGKAGSGFSSSFSKGSSGIAGSIKKNLGLAAGVFVPLGLAAAVGSIAKIGIEYENNLNIFKSVSGATAAQMGIVADKARALGADVKLPGVSAAGAAAAMTELAKAGFTVQQSMDAARATLQLSRIANISEGQAAEIAANAVNAFGIQAKDTGKVVDELAAAANSSSIEITEASDSFKQAAATFSGFQGPAVGSQEAITELNTAIAILGNNGIKGSDAGTSLKQMLLQLTGPSIQAKDIMKELALNAGGANVSLAQQNDILHGSKSVRDKAIDQIQKSNKGTQDMGDIAFTASGKMRSLRDILKLTAEGTKGMTDEEKDYAVTQIFGADASRSVIALLKGGLPIYDKQRQAVLQQGAAASFAAAKNAGLGGAIDNVKSQFENAAIEIYNQVKGPLTTGLNAAAGAIAPLANGVRDLGGLIRGNSTAFGAIAAVVAGAASAFVGLRIAVYAAAAAQRAYAVAQTVIAFVQLASQVRSFAEAWALLDAAMAANPIGIVVVAIGALVAALVYAYTHSETFRAIVQGAFNGIKVAAQAVATFFVTYVLPALQAVWNGIAAGALWLWHNVIQPAWSGIQSAVGVVVAIVRGYIGLLTAEFRIVAGVALWLWHNIFVPVFDGISKAAQIFRLIVEIIFKAVVIVISRTLAPVITGLRNLWTVVFGALRASVQGWWAIAHAVFELFRKYIVGPFVAFIVGWKNLIVGVFHAIASVVADWYNAHIKKYVDAARLIWTALGISISAVWNGKIKPIFAAFVNYVKGTVVGGFKAAVAFIKATWDTVKSVARQPVAFVVNHVINPFIGGLNKAASIVGVKDRVEPIKGFVNGGLYGRAQGGKISGAGGISDNRQALIPGVGAVQLQGGEYIVNRQMTAQALPLLRWLNAGMKGGPRRAAQYLGRPMADMPGDGSEGWAFKSGGLVGWAENVWDSVTHPLDTIKKPFEAALSSIPGSGMIKDFLVGSANRLVNGAVSWVKSIAGGSGSGSVGKAVNFLHQQDGKPYVWASAGPGGYDCSGIVSAVYNIMHGRSPYSHTFSTESAGSFFPKPGQNGPMAAAWSHPGQAPAGASVGHMMGRVGNLNFESTGSRGVHLGKTTRSLSDFAQIGHYAQGGLFDSKVRLFDQGGYWPSGTLGANLSGHTEYVRPGGAGAGETHFHFHNHGVIGSQAETDRWLEKGVKRLQKERKLP
jgi:TP901 family phage tail tape measure protein